MEKNKLGNQGLIVPKIGFGCMGMTQIAGNDIYGKANETESTATIHRSLELGGNFLDTADLYGPLQNEQLIAKAVNGNTNQYINLFYLFDDMIPIIFLGKPGLQRPFLYGQLRRLLPPLF